MIFFDNCKNCNIQYQKKSNRSLFCSKLCRSQYEKNNKKPLEVLYKICKNCNKEFSTTRKVSIFCSHKCACIYNGKIGKVGGNNVSIEKFVERYGDNIGNNKYKEFIQKISDKNKGKVSPMAGKTHSTVMKNKISESVKNSKYHKNIRGKHLSIEEKDKISKSCKGIYTISWFIKKYGEIEGLQKYRDRAKKVSETSYFKIYNRLKNKNNYSKMSQKLFWIVYNSIPELKKEKIYFSELNHEFSCGIPRCCFDFVSTDRNKIIEFNGDKFHANPKKYKENDTPNPYLKLSAKDIWDLDKIKLDKAVSVGYQVLIIWEEEYRNNINEVLKKCIDFLKE